MLNIFCDIINDVMHKHVYVWRIWPSEQSDNFGNDWLQLLRRRVDISNNILINVLRTVYCRYATEIQYIRGIQVV